MSNLIINADCLDWMREQPSDSVDLVFGSPPYEAQRTYGIGFRLKGQAWVDWMVERIVEMVRICNGLVAMVVEGFTKSYRWSATPALLMADLHRRGVHLRKPPIFHRVGIAGSGGPDWLRNDYEFIVCCSKGRKLPWSDNTAMGHPPKWAPGGAMSHRVSSGARVNQWGHSFNTGGTGGSRDDVTCQNARPSHRLANGGMNGHGPPGVNGGTKTGRKLMTRQRRGSRDNDYYNEPAIANPGNVIWCKVGGGVMGSRLCHENEAPFPERLAEFFVRSFCPPGGIVLDPFSGSGTTARVAQRWGRQYIALDVRQSQCELTKRRLAEPGKPAKKVPKKQKPSPSQLAFDF